LDTALELMKIEEMHGYIKLKKYATTFIKDNYIIYKKTKLYQCLASEPSHEEVMATAEVLK
jgi:hypothetical protein